MKWKDVVYGPVKSRRLGQSLGINLTPLDVKVCNFSCGYCRVGVASNGIALPEMYEKCGWSTENVKEAITTGLQHHSEGKTPLDYITLAGNGESTLYPWFKEVVDHLLNERLRLFPDKPTAVFTNATKLYSSTIREAVYKLDRRFFKLDAGDEETFQRINQPIGVSYDEIMEPLLCLDNFELSIAITGSATSNYSSFFQPQFVDKLQKMHFFQLFLYDIDIPKTISSSFNRKTEREKLENLAQFFSDKLGKKIGKEIVILWEPTTRESNIPLYPKQIG